MKSCHLILAVMALAIALLPTVSTSADNEASLEQQLAALKQLRLKTTQELYEQYQSAFEAGTVSEEQLIPVMRQLVEAERGVAASQKSELEVLNESVRRLKRLFAKVCPPGYPPEPVMGERNEYRIIQVEIQTGEIAIIEFRLKNRL